MLKYEYDNNHVRLDAGCTTKELVIGSVLLIGSIYVTLKRQSPQDAEEFRAAVRKVINDENTAIWEDTDGSSICVLLPCEEEE